MESIEIKGHWKQIRGKAKFWWGKLTDDDLDVIDGKYDQLLGTLQIKYGFTRKKAAQEINKRLKELQTTSAIKKKRKVIS
jgi:uncharacterized protein YjbJ (UPF0337 family)